MIRAIYLFILIAALSAAGVWLANNPGGVNVRWGGYVIETSMVFLAGAAVVTALLLTVLFVIYRWIRKSPGRLGNVFASRKRSRGFEAISNGMVAIAAGDANEARRAAVEAEKHLKGEPMTLLLAAQAAELNNDDRAARIYYDRMAEREDTEFLGLRGLIARARAENDLELAYTHARRADQLKPGTEWVMKELLELLLMRRDFVGAETIIARMARGKAAKKPAIRHLKAVVLYEQARAAHKEGHHDKALGHIHAAHEEDPDFIPATALMIRLMSPGRKRDKLIASAWAATPHPDIAEAVKNLVMAEAPEKWLQRAKNFMLTAAPDHRETKLALARAAFAAREWGEARTYLDALDKDYPSVSVYRLLADLEEQANADAAAARTWIIKSTEAPQDPTWICSSCGSQSAHWDSHCPSCERFDSLTWRSPSSMAEEVEEIEAMVVEEIAAPAKTES